MARDTRTRTKKRGKPARAGKKKGGWRTAASADRHELYELSVQDTGAEVDLIYQVWQERRGRAPKHIREDFCGTAAMSAAWVKHKSVNTAIGVDIDQAVMDWGMARHEKKLSTGELRRLKLVRGDVMKVKTPAVDSVLAMNFSYFLFKTRPLMKKYFKCVHAALVRDGLFLLDAYGGSDSFLEMEEERDLDGFTYIWDQNKYNPITGEVVNYIHFEFPDGTKLKRAFTYEWRLWTLPELQELLLEAGFRNVTVYWEGTDKKTDEGNGVFTATTEGEAVQGWIAYLVAEK